MKLIVRLMLGAALAVLAIWAWGVFFPNPQKVIEKRLAKLAQLASFPGHEGNIAKLASIERMGSFFAPNVEVTINVPGVENHTFNQRDELMQSALAVRSSVNGLKVEFVDSVITVAPDQQSATADLTLKAKAGTEKDLIVQVLKFTWKKIDDDWLITRVETVKSLR